MSKFFKLRIGIMLCLAAYFPVAFFVWYIFEDSALSFVAEIFAYPLVVILWNVVIPIYNFFSIPDGKGPGSPSSDLATYTLAALMVVVGLAIFYFISCLIAAGIESRQKDLSARHSK